MGSKLSEILNKIKNLPVPGKVQALIKVILFVDAAFFIGLWLGIKIFFPDDFVLSKINEQLFVKDLALLAEDVDVSLLGNISFEEGSLLQKGNKVITFTSFSFSPALFDTLGGHPAGDIHVEDINAQGGGLDASFDTSENPCYSLDTTEVPLSLLKPFLADVVLTGSVSGGGSMCSKEGKYSGNIELNGSDVVLRGKIPTPMGDFDVGKIILGDLELVAEVTDNKAEIKKLSLKGIVELDATGKINLNMRNFPSSRLDLEVSAKVPDMAKIAENAALNLLLSQLSPYKGDKENSFAFNLKGFVNKPQMSKVRGREPGQSGSRQRKTPSSRPQRLQRQERLPQPRPEAAPESPANRAEAKGDKENEELKKKEDELKRKEEELRRKEEAAKEQEEKMREERERREKEEQERREEEEKKRIEDEARIREAQEAAMNEIRRAREEMEAARKTRESQEEEGGEAEPPKPEAEEKESEEE